MRPLLTTRGLRACIAVALVIVVTSSCGACHDLPTPAPNVSVVYAAGNAVDDLVLQLVAPDGETFPFEGSQGGYYAVYGTEIPTDRYQIVLPRAVSRKGAKAPRGRW